MEIRAVVETEEQLAALLPIRRVGLIYLDEACFPDAVLPGKIRLIRDSGKRAGLRLRRVYRQNQKGLTPGRLLRFLREAGALPDALLLRSLDELGECCSFPGAADAAASSDPLHHAGDGGLYAVTKSIGLDACQRNTHQNPPLADKSLRDLPSTDLKVLDGFSNPMELVFDYPLYAYNHAAAACLSSLGADRLCYPVELSLPELLDLREEMRRGGDSIFQNPHPQDGEEALPGDRQDSSGIESHLSGKALPRYELMVYGRIPMMVSANCLQKTSAACDRGNRVLHLKDRRGKTLPCRCYCKYCYNQIFNAEPCVLYDLPEEIQKLRPDSLRYDFSVESGGEAEAVLSGAYQGRFTRGHFRKKME